MVDGKVENIYVINAPAGSGKTTMIRTRLLEILNTNPNDKILCITFTNRAAEELKKGMESSNIFFGTIHSYINSLISPFFAHKEIIDLYWEVYGEQIRNRISNQINNENIAQSNQKYIDKYGELNEELLRKNISKISYNETAFNSLFYGGLSHDDLIIFAKAIIDKYPSVRRKIVNKYNFIFIDEYQDTSSYVLKLFYDAVLNTKVKMYLLGDRMQQIYKNYDGSFEKEFKSLNMSIALSINHRSLPLIINILNNIYNNPLYDQDVSEKNKDLKPDYLPEIIITRDIEDTIKTKLAERKDFLVLYLLNNDKYKEIGASMLYRTFSRMDKYSFSKKNNANDVLSDNTESNPDVLLKFLFSFHNIMTLFKNKNFGSIITQCKFYKEFYTSSAYTITKHEDKSKLTKIYKQLSEIYFAENCNTTINQLLNHLIDNAIINNSFVQGIREDMAYEDILNVCIKEIRNLANFLNEPHISTQHGVKGESHTSVLFVAADSSSIPIVHMYNFFRIWSKIEFSLDEIEDFYYKYVRFIAETETQLGMPTKDLNASSHNENEKNQSILKTASEKIINEFKENKIFDLLCKDIYQQYLNNPTVTNAKKCFKESTVYGIFSAYKLFYVGCSRARKNLTVIIDESKITGFKDKFIEKVKKIGFDIK